MARQLMDLVGFPASAPGPRGLELLVEAEENAEGLGAGAADTAGVAVGVVGEMVAGADFAVVIAAAAAADTHTEAVEAAAAVAADRAASHSLR